MVGSLPSQTNLRPPWAGGVGAASASLTAKPLQVRPRSGPHSLQRPIVTWDFCSRTYWHPPAALNSPCETTAPLWPDQQRYSPFSYSSPLPTAQPTRQPLHCSMGIKRSRRASVSSEDSSTPYSREQSADIKFVHLDSESAVSNQPAVMRCSLPPHEPLAFDSFEAYDVHYQKTHMNRCSECQKNFPDEHFLHLHIAENHDPINAAKRDKGEKTVGTVGDAFPYTILAASLRMT
jgi:hypothetical protein